MDKKDIIAVIYEVLRDTMEVDINRFSGNDKIVDMGCDAEDLCFLFVPEVEEKLGCSLPLHQWESPHLTIDDIADLFMKHLKSREKEA